MSLIAAKTLLFGRRGRFKFVLPEGTGPSRHG